MGIFNTKVFLEIQVKGYPVGKRIKCHLWLENEVTRAEVEKYVKGSLIFSDEYKKDTIEEVKIYNLCMTNTKKGEENFGDMILDSVSNAVDTETRRSNKKSKVDLRGLSLKDYTDLEIEAAKKRFEEELVMRRFSLLREEFEFYKDNQTEINIEDVKDVYKKCDGDIYKLRKEKIRENIKDMLKTKEVID
jgi:hypothetical protein